MIKMIVNFEDLKYLPTSLLLSLAQRANFLWKDGKCDDVAMHHITNAVSFQKYGIEDVVECNDDTFNHVGSIIFENNKIITMEE